MPCPGHRGGETGLGAFSGPAAPLCAPQTDTQPAATFTAPHRRYPSAFGSLPATVKVAQVSNPQMEGRKEKPGVGEKCAPERAASECVCVCVCAKAPDSHRAARRAEINYWTEEMSQSVTGLQLYPRTVITTRLRW